MKFINDYLQGCIKIEFYQCKGAAKFFYPKRVPWTKKGWETLLYSMRLPHWVVFLRAYQMGRSIEIMIKNGQSVDKTIIFNNNNNNIPYVLAYKPTRV